MLVLILAGLVLHGAIDPPAPPPDGLEREFIGDVRVVDGDTVSMRGRRLRLAGIDAPETDQTCTRGGRTWSCGEESSAALATWIGGSLLTCLADTVDRYGRPVARCTVRGFDVAAWSVENGWSLASPKGRPDYGSEEAQARSRRLGIWSGEFIPPWDWRAAHGIDNQ